MNAPISNKNGSTAGTVEPKNQTNQEKYTTKLRSDQECAYWPDVVPEKDRTGERQGRLLILRPMYLKRRSRRREGSRWHYLAICDCGNEHIVNQATVMSCGCAKKDKLKQNQPYVPAPARPRPGTCVLWPDAMPGKDVAGQRHGKLTYLYPYGRKYTDKSNSFFWLCECECGGEKITRANGARSCDDCYREAKKGKKAKYQKSYTKSTSKNYEAERDLAIFDRVTHCMRHDKQFICARYHECQWDRIENKAPSARWVESGGKCYEMSEEEKGFELLTDRWRFPQTV